MPTRVKAPWIADVIVHPERLEILRAIETNGPMTVREIGKCVRPISESSLYRHVRKLTRAGALRVVETRLKNRGAPETVYAIAEQPPETFHLRASQRSSVRLQRYLVAIQSAQLAEFEAAAHGKHIESGLFALRYARIYLNRAELSEVRGMLARLKEFAANPPGRRTALSLGVILFPAPRQTSKTAEAE